MHCNLVLFGATGDLASRMLFPSLYLLDRDGLLDESLRVVATGRSALSASEFLAHVEEKLKAFVAAEFLDKTVWKRFEARIDYIPVDATDAASYEGLAKLLDAGSKCESVFYLSTSPSLYGTICQNLKAAGLTGGAARVVMEKPIGHDLTSSQALNDAVAAVFDELAIFRIDHYLGKEAVQNLLALRFANTLFEPLWNSGGIDHVQITVSETVGIEGRWGYYDEMGALRDMVQNHMLQLLCLVAMEPPSDLEPDAVRNEKVKVLRSLKRIKPAEADDSVVFGQYAAGAVGGASVPGYREEEGGRDSDTETFVALKAEIENWRWAGVPFYLRTGKRLPTRYSEIYIRFRNVPHSIFPNIPARRLSSNKLIIRLQPEEGIKLLLLNKVPGLDHEGMKISELPLNLSLSEHFETDRRRIAYERLLLDVIDNNSTLFVRRDEVEAAWAWIDDIHAGWKAAAQPPRSYTAGTWGPSAAVALTERNGHTWHE